ncbi:hypothetical protein SELR_pSRC700020 (plasmid) [Selenomonas ruminantium subsp. lactilytica TAM6421]|uniref:Uncharacterized protein n=1 Tax=Selenomonas ruminantium subsp. lactilytica (strain NBRC 103574 / TAM6421) TaxID=927704 RepID=I0GVJ8_SELRL|nr:hypothetical protein [Selenomonas ruminantium]BAL84785.1 hypothetical protein SELR_pSRC700020 [Selenomonas ruminantium subsp. lactilytica TAM6421]
MAKKQVKIDTKRNPFAIDKSLSPADNFLAPQTVKKTNLTVHNVQNVHSEHNVQNIQTVHNEYKSEETSKKVVIEEDRESPNDTYPLKRSESSQKGKKHIHLVLTIDKYEMLEKMANLQHQTVTKCISEMIEDQYTSKWSAISDQLEQIKRKLAVQSPKRDILNM